MEIQTLQEPATRRVNAGRGAAWIGEGFSYFSKAPWVWMGITLILGVSVILTGIIPPIQLLLSLVTPVLSAGLLMGCAELQQGKPLTLAHLFAGFASDKVWTLVLVGLLSLLAYVAVGLICIALLFVTVGTAVLSAESAAAAEIGLHGVLPAVLVALALAIPVAMATWFAAPLVIFRGLSAIDALQQSFAGCLRNMIPFLLYGLLAFVMFAVAAIPFGLGLLVAFPVLVASVYVGYRDIYG